MFGATDLELEIMGQLRSGSKLYGLEMVKASEKLKRGSIYVYLGRMEKKEWLQSEAEKNPAEAGLPRRRYRITGKGAKVYDRALSMASTFAALGEGA